MAEMEGLMAGWIGVGVVCWGEVGRRDRERREMVIKS